MTETSPHKLLEGTFSPDEARHILLSLVKSKIDFHNMAKLSNEERFGEDPAPSAHRLAELHQLHETFKTLCQSAAGNGQRVEVKGWIEITLVPRSEAPPKPV